MSAPRCGLQGDEAALYARYSRQLERHVAAAVNAPQAVIEDACAIAWAILLRRQPSRESAFAWLRVVAIREAYRLDRRERRDLSLDACREPPSAPAMPEPVAASPEFVDVRYDVERAVEARGALRSLAALPVRGRDALALRVGEIAAATGTSPRAVQRHLARARRALRDTAGS